MSEPTVVHKYSMAEGYDPILTVLYLSDGTMRWVDAESTERPRLLGLTLAQLNNLYDGHRRRA